MNKIFILLILATTFLSSCELIKKEIKKVNTIRKSAQKACDCSYVSVSTDNRNGVKSATLTISKSKAADFEVNAHEIMEQLKSDYPAICDFSSIVIDYGSEEYDFYGCEEIQETVIDTLLQDIVLR